MLRYTRHDSSVTGADDRPFLTRAEIARKYYRRAPTVSILLPP